MWSTLSGTSFEYIDKANLQAELSSALYGNRRSRKSIGRLQVSPRLLSVDDQAGTLKNNQTGIDRRRVSSASIYKMRHRIQNNDASDANRNLVEVNVSGGPVDATSLKKTSCSTDATLVDESGQPRFDIVTINVSGQRFQTFAETLDRYPHTLLGDSSKRRRHYNSAMSEYFFDRHRACFEAILYFYQSSGRLRRPDSVPVDIFVNELRFFEMGPEVIEKFWILEGYRKPRFTPLPRNKFQRFVWQLMELPDSSIGARIVAFFSVFVIVLSTTSFCLETIPRLGDQYKKTRIHNSSNNVTDCRNNSSELDLDEDSSRMDWSSPFCVIEFTCICWFTFELIVRFLSCPNKLLFCQSFLNIIDLIAIVPFFINLALQGQTGSAMSFAVLRIFRLVRVFRIFKLSRHSRGLQILGKTFKASVQELCLLFFFMMIALVLFSSAVYFAEGNRQIFASIPDAFWFTIATMTTVGYGDLVPKKPVGRLVGGVCALVGVLVLALPVPVIVANFKHFYRQETRLAHMNKAEQSENDDESFEDDSRSS